MTSTLAPVFVFLPPHCGSESSGGRARSGGISSIGPARAGRGTGRQDPGGYMSQVIIRVGLYLTRNGEELPSICGVVNMAVEFDILYQAFI